MQLLDLVRRDRAAAADHYADVTSARLSEHVDHVAEVLVVPALVGAAGDGVGVFLDRGAHDVGDAAVVPEMNDFGAVCLQQPADDVDRRVVSVEKRRRTHEAKRCCVLGILRRLAHRGPERLPVAHLAASAPFGDVTPCRCYSLVGLYLAV